MRSSHRMAAGSSTNPTSRDASRSGCSHSRCRAVSAAASGRSRTVAAVSRGGVATATSCSTSRLTAAIMAVPIKATADGEAIETGRPSALFRWPGIELARQGTVLPPFMVSKDGQRFLFATADVQPNNAPLTMILNWRMSGRSTGGTGVRSCSLQVCPLGGTTQFAECKRFCHQRRA